jgi:hypothetical protein
MLQHKTFDSSQFVRPEPIVVRLPHGRQPELGCLGFPRNVNVRRFTAITRKNEEPIWSLAQDCRAHLTDCRSFSDWRPPRRLISLNSKRIDNLSGSG